MTKACPPSAPAPPPTAYRAIRAEVTRLVQESKLLPVLIVDEAQFLRNDVLDDLRLLTNYSMDSDHRLCLLLVGLTELRRRLSMAIHESLNQRLVVRHHLGGLDRDELDSYLAHRLRLAGSELPLFDPPAVEALFPGLSRSAPPDQPDRSLLPLGGSSRQRAHRQPRTPATRPRRVAPLTAHPKDCHDLPALPVN